MPRRCARQWPVYDPRDPATAASDGPMPGRPYRNNADIANLHGVRLGVVREFMKVHTKADEDSVAIADAALRDLAKAGATVVDPGREGALFRDALAEILPALDAPTLAAVFAEAFPPGTDLVQKSAAIAGQAGKLPADLTLRIIAERDAPAPGEVLFGLERSLHEPADTTTPHLPNLTAKSTFYNHAPIAGVTAAPKVPLADLAARAERLTRTRDCSTLGRKLANTTPDITGWHVTR